MFLCLFFQSYQFFVKFQQRHGCHAEGPVGHPVPERPGGHEATQSPVITVVI
jgi:hypothetical protein